MKKLIKTAACAAFFALALAIAYSTAAEAFLPDRVRVSEGESFSFGGGLLTAEPHEGALAEVSADAGSSSCNATLKLFGVVPLRTVRMISSERVWLIPGGMTFGVKMFTEGVIVVGLADVRAAGGSVCPAEEAGLQLGDIILSIDGVAVKGNSDLCAVVEASRGRALSVRFTREGEEKSVRLTPAASADGGYRAGMWVRDSSAGVGTVTYINGESGVVAGLGHGVTDSDTGVIMPLSSGELVPVTVTGVSKGQSGAAGELKGAFSREGAIATLEYNCACGVFGYALDESFYSASPLPAAYKQSVKVGPARVLCTVDASGPAYYDVEIESVNLSDAQPSRNMVLRITDKDLIAKTGGIVQGMSGSPIIQNGCIVGALTHVFLNDPERGYGIFIENMLASESYLPNRAA